MATIQAHQDYLTILKRAGCGCIIIPVTNFSEILIQRCGGDGSLYFTAPSDYILPENRAKAVWLTLEEHERIFGEMDKTMALGRKFETLTRTLGIKS